MRIALLFVSSFALTIGAVGAEPWRDYFGVVDSATLKPLSGVALTLAIRVKNIDADDPAAQAGMKNGDSVLASSGCRVYGLSETMFMRHTDIREPMRLLVQRDGKILEISATGARPRTIGLEYHYDFEAHLQVLTEIGLPLDQEADPAGWRSWRQFPPRLAVALVIAAQADPQASQWLLPLYRHWRALCLQDFAAAATETWTPPESLKAQAAFWKALAQRNREHEQDPDPVACGVDTLRFAYWYPWPLVNGPAVGTLVPEVAAAVEMARTMPVFLRENRNTWTSEHLTHLPNDDAIFRTVAQNYVGSILLAAVDPKQHRSWPHRHQSIVERDSRRPIVAALAARLGDTGPSLPWIRSAYLMGSLVEALLVDNRERRESMSESLSQNQETFVTLAKESPWLAWRTAGFMSSDIKYRTFRVWCARSMLRQFVDEAGVVGTATPSRLLAWCHAREPGLHFVLGDSTSGDFGNEGAYFGFRALSQPRTRADLVRAIAALIPESTFSERRELFTAWLDMHRGVLQYEEATQLVDIVGHGQAIDLLMEALPEILQWQAMSNQEFSFYDPLINTLLAYTSDFDVAALQQGITQIDWQVKPELAIRDLQRRYGHPIGCQILAEACAAHGLEALANALHARADRSFPSMETYLRGKGFKDSYFARNAWQRCLVAATSPATAELALRAGTECHRWRGNQPPWNCVSLSMAQALLLLDRPQDCVDALVGSFDGEESKGTEPFIGSFGLIKGEPHMRHWLIQELHKANNLNAPARSRILATAKPGYLTAETLVLFGATEKDLGKPSAAAGNDF